MKLCKVKIGTKRNHGLPREDYYCHSIPTFKQIISTIKYLLSIEPFVQID